VGAALALPLVHAVVSSLGLPWSCDACYDKVLVSTPYPRRESWWPRYIVRAGRNTNCGESFGGLKGATDGFSSIMNRRVKPMLSRSTTVRRAVGGLSARICSSDSLTLLRSKRLGPTRPHHADLTHNTYRSTTAPPAVLCRLERGYGLPAGSAAV
jgi:hypothetical protein